MPEFNRLNFQPVEYVDHKGELRRMIKMTKDGFMLLDAPAHPHLSSAAPPMLNCNSSN
jgi:hypothetical protein